MTDFTRGLDRRTFIFGAAALGAATLLRPTLAFAEPTSADKFAEADSVRARINEMQEQLTIAGENYYKALDEHEAAVQAVADAQARIDEANAQIAELQDKLSKRARSMYRSGQTRIKAEAEQTIQTLEATLQQLDAEAQALLVQEQEAARAAEAAAAAAEVKRTYAYSTPSASIPSQGSVVDYALSRIGCPYVWGAAGPNEFDCSGLVTWAYAQVGISVPHQTESMYYAAAARLPVSEAQPGDVLWISYGDGYNGHAGIACNAGGTHYVHAPTFGARVRDTDPLSWAGFTHALRFA